MTNSDRPIAGRVSRSAIWLIGSRLGAKAIDFASLLVLAWILTPQDFGVVAVAMTLVQIMEAIFELPISQVLVRSDAISRPLLNTAFTLGALRGLLLGGILVLLAWPFSHIYGDARLLPLIAFLALAPSFRGLVSPKMAEFARAIDFRRDLVIEVSSKVAGFAIAATCALLTRSYWAIAMGTVATPAMMVVISYILAPFRPRLSLAHWPTFSSFVGWTTAAQAVTAINWQIDWLILGRVVSREQLGTFSLASNLSGLPEQAIIKPIIRPLLSAFSLIRNDPARLREAYLRTATSIFAAGLPLMLGLSLLAEPAVRLALGPKWQNAWPYLELLALTLIPPLFTSPLGPLAMALGRTNVFLRQSLCELCIRVPAAILGALWFGVYGVIGGRAVTSVLMSLVSAWFVRDLIGIPIIRQLLRPWRPALAGGALVLVLAALRPDLAILNGPVLALSLIGCGFCAIAAYAATMLLTWFLSGSPSGFESAAIGAMLSARNSVFLRTRKRDV
ncbi:lipopolysaccharide biosynthesis protein [Sphingomonas sp. PL20]|uniref:lipopolysaccharide biosynthesis protein n=1 Tax=Sphingomonas sp. PL20 TaxID=2760712 RepID=UPI001AE40204